MDVEEVLLVFSRIEHLSMRDFAATVDVYSQGERVADGIDGVEVEGDVKARGEGVIFFVVRASKEQRGAHNTPYPPLPPCLGPSHLPSTL